MASNIGTCVQDVQDHLILGTTGAQPDTTMLSRWVTRAFKTVVAALPPVLETTLTVNEDRQADLDADQVYFVANGPHLLFASEWAKQGNKLVFQPASVKEDDVVTVWYFTADGQPAGDGEVDTSCIFGNDWLEHLAVLRAAADASTRMAHIAGEGDAAGHASMQRVLDEEYNALYTQLKATRDQWFGMMQQRLQDRAAFGEPPPKNAPRAGFVNRSTIVLNALALGDSE